MGLSGIQTVTLAATIELFVIAAALPNNDGRLPPASIVAAIFGVHYGMLLFFNLAIYPVFFDPLRHVPGPRYGYMLTLKVLYNHFTRQKIAAQLYADLVQETPNEGVVALRSLGSTTLLVVDPAVVSTVLVSQRFNYTKPPTLRKFLAPLLGDGLVFLEGEEHRFWRKNTQPAFSARRIQDLYSMMWKKAQALTDVLEKSIEHKPSKEIIAAENAIHTNTVEMIHWATRVSLDMIGIAGLGHDFSSLHNSDDQLSKDYDTLTEPTMGKLLWFFLNSRISRKAGQMVLWNLSKFMDKRVASVRGISIQLIESKKTAIKSNVGDHFDILSSLISSNNFSEEQLTDHLLTFLVVGHETTSMAFVWGCYLLGKHQDMQLKLRTEVLAALATAEDSQIPEIMENLPYLNGVMHEILRLYPTLPMQSRTAGVDCVLLGNVVAKGTRVLMSAWLMNRSPDIWGEDANEFRPNRWIDADGKPNNTGEGKVGSMTFGRGPRACIGEGFVKAEMRCLLSAMVTKFEWGLESPDEVVVPAGMVTIRPRDGMYLKLKNLAT